MHKTFDIKKVIFVDPFRIGHKKDWPEVLTVEQAMKNAQIQSFWSVLPPTLTGIDEYFTKTISVADQVRMAVFGKPILFATLPEQCLGGAGEKFTIEPVHNGTLWELRTVPVVSTALETYPTAVHNGYRWINSYVFKHTKIYSKDNYRIACIVGSMF
jgi:hypothetical protein